MNFSVTLLLFLLSPFLVQGGTSTIGYYPTTGHYYQIVTQSTSVSSATATSLANSMKINGNQGYLATINDAAEGQFLTDFLNAQLSVSSATPIPTAWTAGARKTGDSWFWYALTRVSPQFYNQVNGCTGHCNFVSTPSSSSNCVQVYLPNSGGPATGKWVGVDCSALLPTFIVEFDASSTQGCGSGYTFSPSTGCVDINECLNANTCPNGYTCSNTVGSYSCVDVNECANTSICSTGYACNNTVGSYQCNDVNECLSNTACTFGSTCTNTVGSFSCSVRYFYITSMLNNLVVDLVSAAAGSSLVMTNQSTSTSQLWSFTNEGYIVNLQTGYVLDIYGGDVAVDNQVVVWYKKPAGQNINQLWRYDSTSYTIVSQAGNVVVDVYRNIAAVGASLCIWTPKTTDNLNQQWSLVFYSI